MQSLFEKRYFEEIQEFYRPYFSDLDAVEDFVKSAFNLDWDDNKPRQMIFQVQRFVSLANEIEKIRPGRDGLRMLFLRCCMESLAKLSGLGKLKFFIVFADCFSEKGKQYILSNFILSCYTYEINGKVFECSYDLNVYDFLKIIKVMRDMVVHDGNYWSLQAFAQDDDSIWLTHVESKEEIIPKSIYPNKEKIETIYYFETTLQYEQFIYYFTEACVNYMTSYIKERNSRS